MVGIQDILYLGYRSANRRFTREYDTFQGNSICKTDYTYHHYIIHDFFIGKEFDSKDHRVIPHVMLRFNRNMEWGAVLAGLTLTISRRESKAK